MKTRASRHLYITIILKWKGFEQMAKLQRPESEVCDAENLSLVRTSQFS